MRSATLRLDRLGRLIDPDGGRFIPAGDVDNFLKSALAIDKDVTDIFVWVHGWQIYGSRVQRSVDRLRAGIETGLAARSDHYPLLGNFKGAYFAVTWPSRSSPLGYFKIRERAHQMSERGDAARVLAALLGYLDRRRRRPPPRGLLQTAKGQYLHCVGHSFGGRFLAQAVALAAEDRLRALPLLPRNRRFPFTVDNLLLFQMAARRDIFDVGGRLHELIQNAPLQGPVCLTFSEADRAICRWHRLAEGAPGIGCGGASGPPDELKTARLHPVEQPYEPKELAARLLNVDANWRFRRGRLLLPQGAHSAYWCEESFHLLLSLMQWGRRGARVGRGVL